MKIHVLIENTTSDERLEAEHGLSLFIETDKHNILFDTGQSGDFADNAEKMGLDLSKIDIAILSHGHYDHGGGIKRFLGINDKALVYMNKDSFEPHYNGTEKYIGLDTELENNSRIILCDDEKIIDDELSLYTCNGMEKIVPSNPFGLNMMENGELIPEDFRHEHYLLIKDNGRRILISGCSHKGILNIENWFRPDVLAGGFHLSKLDPDKPEEAEVLKRTAEKLLSFNTQYYTGHCTGTKQYDYLKTIMGDRLSYLSTGKTFTV